MVVTGIIPIVGRIDFVDNIMGGTAKELSALGTRLNVSIATNGDDIWNGTATTIPIPPDAGQQMQVVSTSANDDGSPVNTGIQTLLIHYLDNSGTDQEETITMNGTTLVLTAATNIRFVQELHAMTVGSNGSAVGTITISQAGAPATVYSAISPGKNRSDNTARMVPANKILLIRSWSCSAGNTTKDNAADIRLRITVHHGLLISRVFQEADNSIAFSSSTFKTLEPPFPVPAFGIIKCTSYAPAVGANVQASWQGILLPAPT